MIYKKFRRKPEEMYAFQWFSFMNCSEVEPLTKVEKVGDLTFAGKVYKDIDNTDCWQYICEGDWIFIKDGLRCVISDSVLHEKFDPVDDLINHYNS